MACTGSAQSSASADSTRLSTLKVSVRGRAVPIRTNDGLSQLGQHGRVGVQEDLQNLTQQVEIPCDTVQENGAIDGRR